MKTLPLFQWIIVYSYAKEINSLLDVTTFFVLIEICLVFIWKIIVGVCISNFPEKNLQWQMWLFGETSMADVIICQLGFHQEKHIGHSQAM